MKRIALTTALAALLLAPLPGLDRASADAAGELHLRLERSSPEADATVSSPSELRLWFSQVPQESSTSARIIQGDAPVDVLGEMAQDPDDPKVFAAPFTAPLAPGSYLVAWRTMAADGHVVRGEFGFSVTAD